jgi:hypothetical protein
LEYVKRNVSIPKPLWERVQQLCETTGLPASQIVASALSIYEGVGPLSFAQIGEGNYCVQLDNLTIIYTQDPDKAEYKVLRVWTHDKFKTAFSAMIGE